MGASMVTWLPGNRWWLVAVASGAVIAGGLWIALSSLLPRPLRLADAMDRLEGKAPASKPLLELVDVTGGWGDRFGAWLYRRSPVPLHAATVAALAIRGRSVTDLMAEKGAFALLGLVGPSAVGAILVTAGVRTSFTPLAVSIVLALIGWFLPDLLVARSSLAARADASETVFTFIDLVILERLSNQSATQALHSAAQVSDTPVFVTMRNGLTRARLEQRPAWTALEQVATELELPQLADVADIIRLDEQGAALSGALRARVRELRDHHLMAERIEAQNQSESMTVWMVIPAMVFGLVFLAPPLMALMGG